MRAWEEFLTQQEKELGKETVDKWLRPLKIVRFDACNLYLEASDSFKVIWFEEHMRYRVNLKFFNNNNKKIKVHVAIATHDEENQGAKKRRKKNDPLAVKTPLFSLSFDELDPSSTFNSFITSQSNLLAHKLLTESCSSKEGMLHFNPIYLFGRNGTGKTHLMMSAAAALKEQGLKVIYVRADTFTEHVVKAIRTGEMQTFRKAYRNADALLIDDIEIFSRKSATQEEFFHTFNTLHVEGKQIILGASCPPGELKYIEPRLVSRFEWGIVVPLLMLKPEDMREVLIQKIEKNDFPLEPSVIDFLLETFSNNLKGLVRAIEALMLRSHLNQSGGKAAPLTIDGVRHSIADLIDEEEKSELTPGKIIRTVAEFYGIRMDDILSKSQARECALPRQIAMHLCRDKLQLPYMKIGDIFARDHSTVMASVRQIQKGMAGKNHEISNSVKGVLNLLE
ncbi:MAG: Chromosomal replication initiator protein DnaA [Chlamydiales bacterium]|nr:Chromosomal replication initiator protein DnaA [Chlamydiales bacterium]MCH9620111.1 Chromosomal replication initiator protein DnaA [Chlamydiales bacterium]MCH9623581.1 Chromosomal replication initiator protein DnaA [Chlamydiales bacterium]